ncbi:MAG: hypothetical protein P1U87_06335 [Verrucomicrobiales bacterium]|nr:hypothetical protein [Verrucomicrobiales bacterium]
MISRSTSAVWLAALLLTFFTLLFPSKGQDVVVWPDGPTEVAPEIVAGLEESHSRWLAFQSQIDGSYRYEVVFSSFSGYRSTTTIEAMQGIVSRRSFEESLPFYLDAQPLYYVEEGSEIGSHTRGANPHTMEELYEIARGVLAEPLESYERLVTGYGPNGILESCYKYDVRIADDVPRKGVFIQNFSPVDSIRISQDTVDELEKSFARWSQWKQRINGNYRYEVHNSFFNEYRSQTTLVASGGVISKRRFVEQHPDNQDLAPRSYEETGSEVGSNERGAAPHTLEELYDIARGVLAEPLLPFERLVVKYDTNGILSFCYKYDSNVSDRPPSNGVLILNLVSLERNATRGNTRARRFSRAELLLKIRRNKIELFKTYWIENRRKRHAERREIKKRIRKLFRLLE